VALAEGNSLSASNFYRLAQQLAPHDPAIRAAMDEAVAAAGESRAMTERATVFVRKGDVSARERRWADAAKEYEQAALLAPRDPSVLYKVAGALYRADSLRPAAEFGERAVALAPAHVDAWLVLALIHLAAGALAPAKRALGQAEKLAPRDERIAKLRAKMPR
jgi:tetratricopeptide (TPR) repeat protein